MRIWIRLATFCLSLTLLVGALVHDAAGARMSIDMAASTTLEPQDAGEQVVCDHDCTAPLLSTETSMAALPQAVAATVLVWPADAAVRTRQPDFDTAPPRTTIVS